MKKHSKLAAAALALLSTLSCATHASVISIGEDFDGANVSPDFMYEGERYTYYNESPTDRGLRITSRQLLSTVDGFTASVDAPIEFGFTMQFLSNDIGFVALRGSEDSSAGNGNNEPLDSLFLRIHNFQGGHTGVAYDNNFDNYQLFNPAQGDAFYGTNNVIQTDIVDYGDRIDVAMKNLTTQVEHAFSYTSSFSAGGFYQLSANNIVFDDVYLRQSTSDLGTTDVPEPTGVALMGAGLFGLAVMRRRKKVTSV